jgi:hypothetical protein
LISVVAVTSSVIFSPLMAEKSPWAESDAAFTRRSAASGDGSYREHYD